MSIAINACAIIRIRVRARVRVRARAILKTPWGSDDDLSALLGDE